MYYVIMSVINSNDCVFTIYVFIIVTLYVYLSKDVKRRNSCERAVNSVIAYCRFFFYDGTIEIKEVFKCALVTAVNMLIC